MIPRGAPGSWRRVSRLEMGSWAFYRDIFCGDLKTHMMRRGSFNDVHRKHYTKESGNPVLACQAGVWIRSTRKRFLHLGSRSESSLKRNEDSKDWARFTLPSPKGDCGRAPVSFRVTPQCIAAPGLYSGHSTA